MGLSIGVHLLNLLAIPAIVFVYYFKKYNPTKKGIIYASIISVLILGGLMYGIIPGVIKIAAYFELLFVNSFGFPFNTGVAVYLIILLSLIVLGLYYTAKKGKVILNTALLCFTVILIGYSSFSMIVIRSLADPPMDENSPDNVFALISYLNREQYGDRPLFKGQYYDAQVIDTKQGNPYYIQKNGKYVIADYKQEYIYDPQMETIFPRMYSPEASHKEAYKNWAGIVGTKIKSVNRQGEPVELTRPTFGENLTYFFKYQLGHMYFRYFLWNFAGRQNDIQGHGNVLHGNWISGIEAIDAPRLVPSDKLPDSMKNNKGMNKYYFLPLILGLVGLFFQFNTKQKDFWVVMLLFFFTGIAIVIYLNQYPYQPRERDYAFAGSYYAFAIWIGLGVLGLYTLLKKKLPALASAGIATVVTLVLVPGIMAAENWDDHDRSNRYTARDFAYNYLSSCAKNAILFTNGDNDTFPLWYAQEVEGYRTDVRVVNLSLLNTDWYIDQMKRKAYDSEPVPFSLNHDQYVQGTRDVVYLVEDPRLNGQFIDAKQAMDFVSSDDPSTRLPQAPDEYYIPSKSFSLIVDTNKVIANGTVNAKDKDKILSAIQWKLDKNYLLKSDLMILDLLAHNNWERPVYFAITVGDDGYLGLQDYFQLEGLAYRLVPIKNQSSDGQIGRIDGDIMYKNVMSKFKWGGINNPKVYLDENNLRMTMNLRNNFARLAQQLVAEGKRDSAVKVLDKCMELMPNNLVPYNYFVIGVADGYYRTNEIKKANKAVTTLVEVTKQNLTFYFSLPSKNQKSIDYEIRRDLTVLRELSRMTMANKQTALSKKIDADMQLYMTSYSPQ